MNCFIILLLLSCCGNSNRVGGNNDYNCDRDRSCGCGGNDEDNSCRRSDNRCESDYAEERYDRECNNDRQDDKRDCRRSEERSRRDYDDCDKQGTRTAPWQDFKGYDRNEAYGRNESSYGRNETCGCEEK